MITYELAKQLKDAGFKGSEKWEDNGDFFKSPTPTPTLTELIEACGKKFKHLDKEGNKWYAYNISGYAKDEGGATPEEAVANLWLSLNKKI